MCDLGCWATHMAFAVGVGVVGGVAMALFVCLLCNGLAAALERGTGAALYVTDHA